MIETRDYRETVSTWIRALDKAKVELAVAEQKHRQLQEEHTRKADEVAKRKLRLAALLTRFWWRAEQMQASKRKLPAGRLKRRSKPRTER